MRLQLRCERKGEAGFTLVELLATIAIMGILLAIGTASRMNVVEGNRVESSTNQALSELRLAHSRATNQLAVWTVVMDADSRNYRLLKDGTFGRRARWRRARSSRRPRASRSKPTAVRRLSPGPGTP